ncbi:MAG: hypothetical protein RR376_10545 [Janthinobacterium sp.]
MKLALGALLLLTLCSCKSSSMVGHPRGDLIGLDTFTLAARYGTPASYQHQGEYLQLNYGSAAVGCQVIVLIDQAQRVTGWASTGESCPVN